MELVVTQAKSEETELLAEILTQAMRFKLARHDNAWGSEPYTAQELLPRIEKGNTYAARLGNEIVATLILQWEDKMMWGPQPPIAAYIHQLAIKDGYHGQGIGGRLLDWASQEAAESGRKLLRLDCPPANDGLRAYYEKHGFTWVQDRLIKIPNHTYTAALYERPV